MKNTYTPNSYIETQGISYSGLLNESQLKYSNHLAPIFEAFTNALEAIKLYAVANNVNHNCRSINISLFHSSHATLLGDDKSFEKASIVDNGIGFDNNNFKRLLTYKDSSKGFSNKGSGRIQYLMFFKQTECVSIFNENETASKRSFILSKNYLEHDSVVFYQGLEVLENVENSTSVTFCDPLYPGDKKYYDKLDVDELKVKLLKKYLLYFCINESDLPLIQLHQYVDKKLIKTITIGLSDLPDVQHENAIDMNYCRIGISGDVEIVPDKSSSFMIRSFIIPEDQLDKNEIKLTVKGELIEKNIIPLNYLEAKDAIAGNRYLFLVSSEYLNSKDDDVRGNLHLTTLSDLKGNDSLNILDDIILEHLIEKINVEIERIYPEIREIKDTKLLDIERLKDMFLLDGKTIAGLKINVKDSDEAILRKVYHSDSDILAKKDAELKKYFDLLKDLDPREATYSSSLKSLTQNVVRNIPLQNRTALTYYVARRKLVLTLFNNILEKKLEADNEIDEKLLHNLIFQQKSSDSQNSDLWLINEDFIYFKGVSESQLGAAEFNGEPLFKSTLTKDEEEYRYSLGEDANMKRTDVLLFPEEGKCIIVEFKRPDVNVSKHLTQINNYASIILNLANDKFKINTFYGYLIGEKISKIDVRRHNANYEEAYNFDYLFLPSTKIAGEFGHLDGSLYTEIISYRTLLKRAIKRNQIFIDKLMNV